MKAQFEKLAEKRAKQFARWAVGLSVAVLAAVCIGLLYLLLARKDWNDIEPWAYFVGVVLGLAGGVWSIFFPEKGPLKRFLDRVATRRRAHYSAEFEVEDEREV